MTRHSKGEAPAGPRNVSPGKATPGNATPGNVRLAANGIRQTDCGDFGIRIARDGTWWHEGTPFTRMALVKLFASVLRREEDGTYWLVTPVERGRIAVDDAPFLAVELTVEGQGASQILTFRTNLDDIVSAGADHPLRVALDCETGAPNPYILIRGNLEARLNRPVFYQLVELGVTGEGEDSDTFGVWSKGQFFPIGKMDEIEAVLGE